MKTISGQTVSPWLATQPVPARSTLNSDITTDVCIVGAGIAGITAAYLLATEGRSVAVLDNGPPGSDATGRTTAHLSNAIDDRYFEIERLLGVDNARLAAESHTAAIDRIEQIVRDEGIDCDFERLDGYLFLPPGESTDILERELAAARRAGLSDVARLDRAPGAFDTGPCLRFPRQAQFHPLRYLAALAEAIERRGGRIFSSTHVETIERDGVLQVRSLAGRTVTAGAVIVATNTPINDRYAIHTKQAPYRTYAIGARVPCGSVHRALYWDTSDTPGDLSAPYHYIRLQSIPGDAVAATHELLIVGGEDHKTGQADDAEKRWDRLAAWSRARFPMIEDVEFRWSGQVMETIDGIAFIGRNPGGPEGVYVATGDSGMGMTHGTIAGMLLCDLIQDRPNAWEKLYEPTRKTLRAAGDYTSENLNVAARYADWLKAGEVADADAIPSGHGAIVRQGLTLVAAYRDDDGTVHECSASCTHLGCVVHWNSAEKTWDCPCHGSRFDAYGTVVAGPAASDLKAIEHAAAAAH